MEETHRVALFLQLRTTRHTLSHITPWATLQHMQQLPYQYSATTHTRVLRLFSVWVWRARASATLPPPHHQTAQSSEFIASQETQKR